MSQNLSREDSMAAKFWGYELLREGELAEFEDASHAANIATQVIAQKKLSLEGGLFCIASWYCR